MAKKLYVGGLAYSSTEEEVQELFETIGPVEKTALIIDRDSGRSKGFAFVEMQVDEDADKAIEAFNEYEFAGRKLVVNEARPMEPRKSFGGGGGGGNRDGGSRY